MTIKDYKEAFLQCVEEGYEAASAALNSDRYPCPPSAYTCPYSDSWPHSYEYSAWWTGYDWYRIEVH